MTIRDQALWELLSRPVLVAAALVALCFGSAAAQETFVDRANALYDDVLPSRRSDETLLRALVGLEPAPEAASDRQRARLLGAGSSGWAEAERWAMAAGQRQALEGFLAVTDADTESELLAFAQPYGPGGVPVELIRAGLYTELGDPPLLAAADHRYLPSLDTLALLLHIEATRLLEAGDPDGAADLMVRLAALGEQIADREFVAEAMWGMEAMIDGFRRARDVLFVDFRGEQAMSRPTIGSVIDRLNPDEGVVRVERLNAPRANAVAANQLIELVYEPRRGVRPEAFTSVMTRLSGGPKPLLRFGAAGRVSRLADTQLDWFDVNDRLTEIDQDIRARWGLERFDPVRSLAYRIDQVDGSAAMAVTQAMRRPQARNEHAGRLLDLATVVEVERIGTRLSYAHVGRFYGQSRFAPQLSSVRPQWIRDVEDDPFNPGGRVGRRPSMNYFVPIRDQCVADRRGDAMPHEIEVFPADGSNFTARLFDDTFVIYSVGPDGSADGAFRVAQDPTARLGDYMIWPPVIGLQRIHLRELGELR